MKQKILWQLGTWGIHSLSVRGHLLPTNCVLVLKQDGWCGDRYSRLWTNVQSFIESKTRRQKVASIYYLLTTCCSLLLSANGAEQLLFKCWSGCAGRGSKKASIPTLQLFLTWLNLWWYQGKFSSSTIIPLYTYTGLKDLSTNFYLSLIQGKKYAILKKCVSICEMQPLNVVIFHMWSLPNLLLAKVNGCTICNSKRMITDIQHSG